MWLAFAACKTLNLGLQIEIFAVVLVSLSVLAYHAVEAPLIAVGVRISEKLKNAAFVSRVTENSTAHAAPICSE